MLIFNAGIFVLSNILSRASEFLLNTQSDQRASDLHDFRDAQTKLQNHFRLQ